MDVSTCIFVCVDAWLCAKFHARNCQLVPGIFFITSISPCWKFCLKGQWKTLLTFPDAWMLSASRASRWERKKHGGACHAVLR